MLTPFRKRKRLRKIPLIANNLIKKIIIRSENRQKMLYEAETVKIKSYKT